MKKIIFLAAAALLCMSSCEDFLDTKNLTKKDTTNFPKSAEDADQMITGIYTILNDFTGSPHNTPFWVGEVASDERFGGGGENDKHFLAMDKLMNSGNDMLSGFWTPAYRGIYRANMALETLDNCEVSEAQLNGYKGEAHFLRGYYYWELANLFGQVPLTLKTDPENLPKAEIDLIYGQIAYDLKNAIEKLGDGKWNTVASGHATKWAAEALMARVYLFYTGFYGKSELPLGDGTGVNAGAISKSEVISWIDDCVNNSGHALADDYRRLWSYSNAATAPEYDYVKDLYESGKTWLVDGENPEQVFVIKCSKMAGWSAPAKTGFSNQMHLFFAPRMDNGGEDTFPMGQGWGSGPVNPNMWKEWEQQEPSDKRRQASIWQTSEAKKFILGADKQMEEANYWQKKISAITAHDANGKLKFSFSTVIWDVASNDMALTHLLDLTLIRFADVLLMQSELKGDAEGINKVRVRAGLKPITAYSLDALKKERRFELCFEGVRWNDIRRWGDVEALLAKQQNVEVYNRGLPDVMKPFGGGYVARYKATNGFFPIPDSQISLSEGVLTQNAGWGTPDAEFPGW